MTTKLSEPMQKVLMKLGTADIVQRHRSIA